MRCPLAVLLIVVIGMGASSGVRAHQMNLTSTRIEISKQGNVLAQIEMKGSDIDRAAGVHISGQPDEAVSKTALDAASARVLDYVSAHSAVLGQGDAPCAPGERAVLPDGDGAIVTMNWSCAGIGGPWRYRSTLLLDVTPSARQIVLISDGGSEVQDLLDAGQTETVLAQGEKPGLGRVIVRYLVAGIEHIFLGYDHIAFLAAVVLWARRMWPVVKIVTAFTVAHSITLSLAALDIVRIPSSIIEPAIAASIIYVACENFLSRDIERRWRDTFCFGLIHGFGFASALQEFGLPRDALVPALASFNLGVEIGQIGIVSLVLPILLALDRAGSRFRGRGDVPARPVFAVYTISAVIIGLGSYWLLERTVLPA